MRWRFLFVYLAPMVEKYINEKSRIYNIDLSHNLHHSLQVKELAFTIAEKDHYNLDNRQREVLYLSCMLHDMCDAKYTPLPQSILDVSNFLMKECRVSRHTHDGVMKIITSMSYNKIIRPDGTVWFPRWLENKRYKDLVKVFHITRESDLLTSYDLKRMVHYKNDRLGSIYSCDTYHDIIKTVGSRMNKLLERNLFLSPTATKVAKQWHNQLCDEVHALTEDDIYPIYFRPPEPLQHFRKRVWCAVHHQ